MSTISDLSDIVPLIFSLIYGRNKLRILQIYFLLSFLIKLTTVVLVFFFRSPNTYPFYHALAIVEITTLFLYYQNVISWKDNGARAMLIILVTFNVLASATLQSFWEFNSIAWSVNTLSLLFLSIAYLYVLYSKAENVALESHAGFVINSGFLIYFAGSLFTYLLGFSILSQKPVGFFANGWIIQAIANLIKNIVVSYGISRSNRP